MDADFAIVGGGVVGLSIAWGLARRGHRVKVLDGGDLDFRASRGNFGLVWVQGKGLGVPAYARWTRDSARLWRGFADLLEDGSGVPLALDQSGGLDIHMDEATLAATVARYEALKATLGGDYPFEVLGHDVLKREEPEIGPRVAGAILHHEDGHVNPLRLLRALAAEARRLGAAVHAGQQVERAEPLAGGGFCLTTADGTRHRSGRVVLAAGLGAARLGPQLGFRAPVRPLRGQVLVTEKMPRRLRRLTLLVRQLDEGGVQIGDSKEDVGFDDRTTLDTLARIAARAVATFPFLERARLVRSWGALRVMSPDGLPIYQRSPTLPGASLVNCHSGITLAAQHALTLPDWLEDRPEAPDLEAFGEHRF